MASEPEYVFKRDFMDNNRINLQHYQWVELFGYHLHPGIPTGDDLRIADVATGTGAWLLNLSTLLSETVQLDGLDISFEAAPPPEWLPTNVRLRHWDIREEVPDDLVEKYDVVHLRLLSFVLRDEEIPHILQNITKLIKPGGHLQWAEPDVASWRIETTKSDNKTEALKRLLALSQPQDSRLGPKWVPSLPNLFQSVGGLVDVEADVRDAPGYLALAMHECNLGLHEQLVRSQAAATELRELLPRVAEETRKGAYWAFTRWTVVGRKPVRSQD